MTEKDRISKLFVQIIMENELSKMSLNDFRKTIIDNLPQSISREDISKKETTDEKIEKIMNYIFGEYKDSSEGFSVIPNRVRITLKKHLSSK